MRPVRVQLSRAKGWRMPPNTVKVDRTTQHGNPYLVERQSGALWEPKTNTWRRGLHSVRLLGGPYYYRAYLPRIEALKLAVENFRREIAPTMDLAALRGKNLACWCKPGEPCHADVLLDLANDGQLTDSLAQPSVLLKAATAEGGSGAGAGTGEGGADGAERG